MLLSGPIDLIKKSIQLFFKKENLVYFLKIYVILVPFTLFFFFQDSLVKIDTSGLSNFGINEVNALLTRSGPILGVAAIVNLAFLVVSFWISAAGIKAVANVVSGGALDVKSTLSFAWKKLWIFSLLSIVVGLITGLGFILLIIPGLIFLVWYHFSGFELMTKEVGVGAAMRNSKSMVSGKFWKILGRFIVFGLFGILVQITLSFIPMGYGSVIEPLFGGLLILPYFLLYRELSG